MKKRTKLSFAILSIFLFLVIIGPSFADLLTTPFGTDINTNDSSDDQKYFEGSAFSTDGLIEEIDKRTINSKTYFNPNKSIHTAFIDLKPIHYRDDNGKWQDIVLEFKDSSDPRYSKEYSQGNISIKISEKSRPQDMISVTNRGKELTFSPMDNPHSSHGSFGKKAANYKDVYKDIDFRYTLGQDALKESIYINQPTSKNVFKFLIKTDNLEVVTNQDGTISLTDSGTNDPLFEIQKSFAIDSSPEEAYKEVQTQIEKQGSHYILTLTLDNDWLNDSSRIYPVIIDPTIVYFQEGVLDSDNLAMTGKSAKVYSADPDTNYATDNLSVGEGGSGVNSRYRSYVQIKPASGAIPAGATITNAIWGVYMYAQDDSSNLQLTWYKVTSSWSETGLTWNNQPSYQSDGIPVGYSGATFGWKYWNLTPTFTDWFNAPSTNYGLMLWVNDSNYYHYKRFYGDEYTYESQRPMLRVDYSEKPTATNTSPTNNAWTSDTTPTLDWSYSDPDGDAQTHYRAQVSTTSSFSTITRDSQTVSSSSSAWVTTSALSTNTRYYWRARVYDSYDWSIWSSITSFKLDTVAPASGSLSIANGADYAGNQTVTLNSISATDPNGSNGSGVSQMRFSNDNSTWSTWETYSSTKSSWLLSSGDGSKTVYAQFKDTVGNISSSFSDTVVLDSLAPTATIESPTSGYHSKVVDINGTAFDQNLLNWKLEWAQGSNPTSSAWKTIGNFVDNVTMDQDSDSNGVADGWTKYGSGTFAFDSSPLMVGDGNTAQKISDYSADDNYLKRTIDGLKTNTDYTFSARVKTYNVKPVTGAGTRLQAYNPTIGYHYSDTLAGNIDWVDIPVTFNTGSTTTVDLYLSQGSAGTATGHTWFDDVALIESPNAIFFNSTNSMQDSILSDFLGSFDMADFTSGEYSVKLSVTDMLGRTSVDQRIINVDSDNPEVAITSPSNGTTVNGTVTIQASATDNISGIDKVEFIGTTADLGVDVTAPYEVSWDTNEIINGPQRIRATAYDKAGNELSSDEIEVTVDNAFTTDPAQPIKDWALLGTFENSDQQTRLSTDYLDGENRLTPNPGDIFDGHTWTTVSTSSNYVDLNSIYTQAANQVAYANVYINSPVPQGVKFHFGSDDSIKAWVNGELVHSKDVTGAFEEDSDKTFASLNEGWNQLLVKLAKGGPAQWRFSAKISDWQDYSLGNIEISTTNPFKQAIFYDNFNQPSSAMSQIWTASANVSVSNYHKSLTLAGSIEAGARSLTISGSQASDKISKIVINPNQSNEETLPSIKQLSSTSFASAVPTKYAHQDGEPIISQISDYAKLDGTSSKASMLSSANISTNSYSVDADITYLNDDKDGYLLFRSTDENNTYRLNLGESNKISIGKVTNSSAVQLGGDGDFTFDTNKKYHIKIKLRENEIRVYIDGVCRLNEVDNNNPYLNAGKIGIVADTGSVLRADNVVVWPVEASEFDNMVRGIATDAINGQPVTQLPVTLRAAVDTEAANVEVLSYTENDGSYFLDLDENLDTPLTNYVPKTTSYNGKVSAKVQSSSPDPVNFAIEADHPGFSLTESLVTVSVSLPAVTKNFSIGHSGKISGRVTDINNTPVSGAFIQATPFDGMFSTKTAVSGSDGAFTVDDVNASYTYTVIAAAANYSIGSVSDIKVESDITTTNADIMLEHAGSISGTVTDELGNPLEGATVWAYILGNEEMRLGAETSSTGSYSIEGLNAPGTYVVSASKETFELYSVNNINVQPNQDTPDINLVLGLYPSYVANRSDPNWGYNSKATWGTHEKLTARAINNILINDFGRNSGVYYYFCSADPKNNNKAYWFGLVEGDWYADWGKYIGTRDATYPWLLFEYRGAHGHDPDTHKGWKNLRSGGVMADHYMAVANKKYWEAMNHIDEDGDIEPGYQDYVLNRFHLEMFWLGAAIHFMQDTRVPQHTDGGILAGVGNVVSDSNHHGSYERYVDYALVEKDQYKITWTGKRGIYSFGGKKKNSNLQEPSNKYHQDDDSAFGWVDQGAHMSKKETYNGSTNKYDKYYFIATHEYPGTNLDNFTWVGNSNPIYPNEGYYNIWKWSTDIYGRKIKIAGTRTNVNDDYWWKNKKLVENTIRSTAGFIYGYYAWDVIGDWHSWDDFWNEDAEY